MAWWSDASTEPKRKNRFFIRIGTGGILYSVSSVSKPNVSIETKEYRLINHFYKYPGIPKWEDISIKFVDAGIWGSGAIDIGAKKVETDKRSTSKTLWEMLLSSGYVTPRGSGNTKGSARVVSPEKAAMVGRSFGASSFQIVQLNADGKETEIWTLYNPVIKKINWGELDYADDGLVEYTLDISYDWAELQEKT